MKALGAILWCMIALVIALFCAAIGVTAFAPAAYLYVQGHEIAGGIAATIAAILIIAAIYPGKDK